MLRLFSRERMWRQRDLQRQYDVVIIGDRIHGLAIAYYLCKRGIRNVAVLDRSIWVEGIAAATPLSSGRIIEPWKASGSTTKA